MIGRDVMRAAVLMTLLLLGACASPLKPVDFAGTRPKLDPEQFFAGHLKSFGVFEGGGGAPQSRFTTDSTGTLEPDGSLVMAQTIRMNDGTTIQRTWHLHADGPHDYVATAAPVIGTAVGQAYGRAFHWEYDYALKPHDWLRTVHFEHWMYLSDDGKTLLNRFAVRKLGITVARASEIFQHVP